MDGFVFDEDPAVQPEPDGTVGGNDGKDNDPKGPGWKVAALLFVLLAGLAALGIYAQHWKKTVWVREVVFSGNRLVASGELEKKAEGLLGRNIGDVDGSVLSQRYAELPYIRSAEVAKELNGIVRVRVEERVPVAEVVGGDKVQVIDTEGYILPYRDLPPSSSRLLRVTGLKTGYVKGMRLKKADEKSFAVLEEMIQAVSLSEYARLLIKEVFLKDGNKTYFAVAGSPTRFILGNDGDYKEKLKKFEIFWQKVVAKKGLDGYATVDLRFAKRVFAVESSRQNYHGISR